MQEINDKQLSLTKQGVDPYVDVKSGPLNYLYIFIFIACLIAAWVLFFVYATGGQVAVWTLAKVTFALYQRIQCFWKFTASPS